MYFDRFDIVEAHYLAACEWGDYAKITRITSSRGTIQAKIRRIDGRADLEENGQEIYDQLTARYQAKYY